VGVSGRARKDDRDGQAVARQPTRVAESDRDSDAGKVDWGERERERHHLLTDHSEAPTARHGSSDE